MSFWTRLREQARGDVSPGRRQSILLDYVGGHPSLAPRRVLVRSNSNGIVVTAGPGKSVEIDRGDVLKARFLPNAQAVGTNGVSAGGTLVGGLAGNAIAGPVGMLAGAAIGSRGRTKIKTVRNDMIVLELAGIEMYFAGNGTDYQRLCVLLGKTT